MEYFEKLENNPYEDLYWNIPEKKQGSVNVIGGNLQNFRTEIKITEYMINHFPFAMVNAVLPEALKNDLPPVENFKFLKSTESGSFAGDGMEDIINSADFNLVLGDLSKNSITGKAVVSACENSENSVLFTRDSVDLLAENQLENLLLNDKMIIFGSMMQFQKIFKAIYYPKMLLLSQPLTQVVEILHKFTLSFPIGIVTLHNGQIIIAKNGEVKAVAIEKSKYSPITIWNGELATKIVALNLYNPNDFIHATVAAVYYEK